MRVCPHRVSQYLECVPLLSVLINSVCVHTGSVSTLSVYSPALLTQCVYTQGQSVPWVLLTQCVYTQGQSVPWVCTTGLINSVCTHRVSQYLECVPLLSGLINSVCTHRVSQYLECVPLLSGLINSVCTHRVSQYLECVPLLSSLQILVVCRLFVDVVFIVIRDLGSTLVDQTLPRHCRFRVTWEMNTNNDKVIKMSMSINMPCISVPSCQVWMP